MTGTNAGADSGTRPGWRWDVALSFAAAQRDYVEQVAEKLRAKGVRCFYDADEQIELWGKNLAEELPAIYGEQVAAVVMFVSAEYAAREWTRLERRAALAQAVRKRLEYVLPARFDDTPLPGLLPDVSYVDLRIKTPQQFAAMIAAKLATLGITARAPSSDRESIPKVVEATRPAGAMRAGEADPRRLGVHAAISVPGVPDDVLPEYVPRDTDAAEFGIRVKVAAAAERGGFVLLVGGSSVGKTRCAVEAVRALLPGWWLVHPDGPTEVAALAAVPSPRTVVWLDELQDYLDGEHGLTGGMVRALLNPPHPAVIIGTIWPDRYSAYTALPVLGSTDSHARERKVLDLADVVRVGPEFSPAEQARARAAAARDRRLAIALEAAGYGLTQILAAAPQLVARWEDARTTSPYAWAVLTAALDAARLGARAPLNTEFLRAAAPGYCTSQQQAEATDNWFDQALDYATGKLHGAIAALTPVGIGMGQITGYIPADYLIQHASQERRSTRVPASTWDAILSHIHDPADAARLADSARNRLLYSYATPLYRHAADVGDRSAAEQLTELLARRGDLDGLRARADAGDRQAANRLADLLAERGDLDGATQVLRTQVGVGSLHDAMEIARLAAEDRDLDGLRARANTGDEYAARMLARLLYERGDLNEAEQLLSAQADAGDWHAAIELADLLARRGDLDGLRARAYAGDRQAVNRLAVLLAENRNDLDALRVRADAGDRDAAALLAERLLDGGDLHALRARADTDDWLSTRMVTDQLARRGDLDGLRARADAGSLYAARVLAVLLARCGDLDGLRARADAGDPDAAVLLAELLAERGDLDELRARADTDAPAAAVRLVGLLAGRGDLDGLRDRISVGDEHAAFRLAELLAKRGRKEEAERLRRFGLNPDGSIACM